ncbi:TetR/AcrR family transcriptional regulator C-terminal domain-containing protein [Bosea vestrisii]|uniref:TetR/AcrR family transcriptional regulator C-terminal domain-containing protein n=1 Tax=Bosea vestrisii TaxID=151416 RepID=UPI003D767E34
MRLCPFEHLFLSRAVIGVAPRFPSIGAAIFESNPKVLPKHLAVFLGEAHQASRLLFRIRHWQRGSSSAS